MSAHGLTTKHASRLAKEGWLQHLGHGAYALAGDTLDRDACLAWLVPNVSGLHVAGKTALSWRGVRHNLAFRKSLTLWGDKPTKLPPWFTTHFPAHYQATNLFDARMPPELGTAPLPSGRPDVPVSTPERALLELLSDVGKRQTLEEAKHLVEGARSLRVPVLEALFSHLSRIKVVRLAIAPAIFETPLFALKGGTALNLFVQDLPRLSVDIDVVFVRHDMARDDALKAIQAS